jgi:signal transduction histidine kinase
MFTPLVLDRSLRPHWLRAALVLIGLGVLCAGALPAAERAGVATGLEILSFRYGASDYNLKVEDEAGWQPAPESDEAQVRRYGPIRLPTEGQRLSVFYGAPFGAPRFATRLRYKLEGYDSSWRDHERAFMHLVLKFYDDMRQPVSRAEFRIRGNSVGWTGNLRDSKLSERSAEAVVPPRATQVSIWIDSGGHDENTGTWVVDDIRLFVQDSPDGERHLLFEDDFETGRDLHQPQGDFAFWVRDGGDINGAQVKQGPPAQGGHALMIRDSNPLDYSAWRLKDPHRVPVRPGQTVTVEWSEVYSLGLGRAGEAVYRNLPYGQYQFRVKEVDAGGEPVGNELILPLLVAPPFYLNVWFKAASVTSLLLVGLAVERGIARGRMRRRVAVLERKQAVQQERARIARDIHDDLGTVLSRISMTSETASLDAAPGSRLQKRLSEICEASRQLTHTMEEIVWAQDPQHDSLDNTASYFSSFASDLLSVAGIACRLDIPVDFPAIPLDAEKRHDLFLVFKESLNNIIKHAHATTVRIAMRLSDGVITLTVEDDGKGFEPGSSNATSLGNGLRNMQTRLHRSGGSVEIHSRPGEGTRVSFILPLPSTDSQIT